MCIANIQALAWYPELMDEVGGPSARNGEIFTNEESLPIPFPKRNL